MRLVYVFIAFLCLPIDCIHADDSGEDLAEAKRREFLSSLALITRLDSSFEYRFHDSYVQIPKPLQERLANHWPDFEFSIAEQTTQICWTPDQANALIVQRRAGHDVYAYLIRPIVKDTPASFGLLAEEIVWEDNRRRDGEVAKVMFRDLAELVALTQGFELTDFSFFSSDYTAKMEREISNGRRKIVRNFVLEIDHEEFYMRDRNVMIEGGQQETTKKAE